MDNQKKQGEIDRAWQEREQSIGQAKRVILHRLLLAQDSRCYYCRRIIEPDHVLAQKRATIDHFIPKAQGGTDDEQNLVGACLECNGRKGDSLIEEGAYAPLPKDLAEQSALRRLRGKLDWSGDLDAMRQDNAAE